MNNHEAHFIFMRGKLQTIILQFIENHVDIFSAF